MRSICLLLSFLLFSFHSLFLAALPVQASQAATESATVTATVPTTSGPPGTDSIPPSAPILLRPLDGWTTTDTTPEFVWRQSQDPNGNYVAYTVYIDGIAKYLGVSNVGNSAGTGYTSSLEGTEVRLIPTSSLNEGSHLWKVAAYDYAGNLAFSTQWTLTIDLTPPPITITDIDTYHHLYLSSLDPTSVPSGLTFEVTGPKDIYFSILTDPYTNVNLTLLDSDNQVVNSVNGSTGNYNSLSLYRHLEIGTYEVEVSATDRANLVTVLPSFTLRVVQPLITLPIPGFSPPPTLPIPSQLVELSGLLYNYPATIARIASRPSLAAIYVLSIAMVVFILLILLKKRYNLLLLNPYGSPIPTATVSLPQLDKHYSLVPRQRGRLYIPELSSNTELAIVVSGLTTSLCLVSKSRRYLIVL